MGEEGGDDGGGEAAQVGLGAELAVQRGDQTGLVGSGDVLAHERSELAGELGHRGAVAGDVGHDGPDCRAAAADGDVMDVTPAGRRRRAAG